MGMSKVKLYVSECYANGAGLIKRFKARAKGRCGLLFACSRFLHSVRQANSAKTLCLQALRTSSWSFVLWHSKGRVWRSNGTLCVLQGKHDKEASVSPSHQGKQRLKRTFAADIEDALQWDPTKRTFAPTGQGAVKASLAACCGTGL